MTNYERIKDMNIDELDTFLLKVNCSCSEDCMIGISECKYSYVDDGGCKLCFKEWLESTAI